MPFGKEERHESYGMLRFSRVSTKNQILFGSSIKHDNIISMTLSEGLISRELNSDWYRGDKELVVVDMSYSQFAEAISGMNVGSGIPVTIRRFNGKMIESPNFTNKRLQFEKEFENKMKVIKQKLDKLIEEATDTLKNKKSITKSDRDDILNQIFSLKQEIGANIPFMVSQFNEQMDKTVVEAKGEIEAFTQHKMQQFGLQKLEELKLLGESDKS